MLEQEARCGVQVIYRALVDVEEAGVTGVVRIDDARAIGRPAAAGGAILLPATEDVDDVWLAREWCQRRASHRTIATQQGELCALVAADIDTLVLGCTHYPLLKRLLREVLGPDVRLIDSAEETAAETARTLAASNLAAADDADPTYRFVASDDPLQFLQLGQRFLGDTIEGVEIRTLG